MTVEILTPSSRAEWIDLRMPTIGASEVAAMLRVHPYATPFELWAKKSGLVPPEPDNKAMRRGRLLEPIVIDILREERPEWIVQDNPIPGGKFYRDLDAGVSCTPDTFAVDPDHENVFSSTQEFGICQIKTINQHVFQNEWMLDGDIRLPPYVAIQAMQEAHMTGASWCCVAALVGMDLDLHIIEVKIHAGVIARIKRAVPDFLRRIRENDPPDPDYARDGDVLRDLYADDDGATIDLRNLESESYNRVLKLVARRTAMKEIEASGNEAESQRKIIDAELIHMLGNATRGTLADGRVIEAKTVHRHNRAKEASVTSFRSVKIKQQKEKAA